MATFEPFSDDRLVVGCAFCGAAAPETLDHAPAQVFLDLPYPYGELPKVKACFSCNGGLALDEEYVACALECAICGTVDPDGVQRPKVRAALRHSRGLRSRLAAAMEGTNARPVLRVEGDRVERVITKLAHAHAVWELGTQLLAKPSRTLTFLLPELARAHRTAFERLPFGYTVGPDCAVVTRLPELGSRAFLRLFKVGDRASPETDGWVVVQEGRYRYAAFETDEGYEVRLALSEYLGAAVVLEC